MRPGTHAAADGSFSRSAGAAMGRGVLLLAIALVIGIVLLNATDDQPPGTHVAAGSRSGDSSGDNRDKPKVTTTIGPTTTTLPARQPADVKVIVANASDVKGAAGKATEQLKAAKYNALAPANSTKLDASAVYFTAGFDREAAAVATALGLPAPSVKALPTPPPVDVKTANVLVMLGVDHAPRFAAANGATTTTAAAAAGATTTTARNNTAGGPASTTTTAKAAVTTTTAKSG